MAQDFIELFSILESSDVRELELYEFIKYTHTLIQSRHRDSVPNTLRKFYECFLYCCERENDNIKLYYHDEDKEERLINISKTSFVLFKTNKEFYKNTILPFLNFVNTGSHCEGISYASVKKNEIHKNIGYVISLWNWYVSNIRPSLKGEYSIKSPKYSLPEPMDNETANLKNKLESKEKTIRDLKEKIAELTDTISEAEQLIQNYEEVEEETIENEIEENSINMEELENDILSTINLFNEKHIYCTHRTVALFLLGARITQTDFCNFDDEQLFKKYLDNKFSEFEYDLALNNLIDQRKIIQSGMYFLPLSENMNVFKKVLFNLKFKFHKFKLNKNEYSTKIDEKLVEKLQVAISEKKDILVKYYKSVPNTNSFTISKRTLKPLILIPKEKFKEIENLDYSQTYTENLFYLRANDINDENKTKTFRLDKIRFIKYLQ